MTFTIQGLPKWVEARRRNNKTKKECKVSNIVEAKDLTNEEYEEISKRKKMGKTTTEENLQAEKHYWQNFFLTKELDEAVLNNFIYGTNPFYNYLGLIDAKNHLAEDNLRSEKHLEKIEVVKALLERLGWSSARDEDHIVKDDLRTSFAESVVDDPIFKRQKRLNELFDLHKAYNIHKDMTPQQVLMWCNSLLKDFSIQIRAAEKTYYLETQNDILELVKRKNKNGKIYFDGKNLLKQVAPQQQQEEREDPFIDDEPQEAAAPTTTTLSPNIYTAAHEHEAHKRKMARYDTKKLDVGIDVNDD